MAYTINRGLAASILATADVLAHRFVRANGIAATANQRAIGVSELEANNGEPITVLFDGMALIEAGAAVAVNDLVTSDATGRAIPAGTNPVNGIALDAATAPGKIIRIKVQ
jgi:hypothetical protein